MIAPCGADKRPLSAKKARCSLSGFQVMTECNPGMMRGLLVVASLVVLGGFTMMFGSVFVMLCRLFVMLVNLVLCHSSLPAFPRFNTR